MKLHADLLAHLASGPPKAEEPGRWVICVTDSTGRVERVYADAELEHYPDPGKPSHVIVWSPSTVAVIDYYCCDYIYKKKPE